MAGITFTVELDDAAARDRLQALVERLEQPLGFYQNVGEYLVSVAVPRNFQHEQAPDGSPWAKLRPVTVARREKAGQTPITILRASLTLSASIIAQPTESGVEVGSAVPYAAVMQFGAAQGAFGAFIGKDKRGRDHFHHIPWGDIPPRPYLGLSTEDETEILRIADAWLEEGGAVA